MKELQVKFFGGLQVLLDGQPITGHLSDKSLALFGFLVHEAGQAHRREKLAGSFWPEKPETLALAEEYLAQSIKEFESWVRKDHAGLPLALSSMVACRRGYQVQARSLLVNALKCAVQYPEHSTFHLSLAAATPLLIEKGDLDQAVELYALVNSHPTVKNSRLWADLYLRHGEAHFARLPVDTVQLARERGSRLDLFETGQQILTRLQEYPGWLRASRALWNRSP